MDVAHWPAPRNAPPSVQTLAELELQHLSKSYDGRSFAVRDLDLRCPQGQMLALLGPSGCGKSSTLKMVAGIEAVSSGRVLFDGVDVTARSSAGRNVAMVFEDYSLYPHLSVFDNIAFPLQVRGVSGAALARRVDAVVAMLGLQPLLHAPVRSLSGGAQQRVSIGRALVRDPALVMFDEPLSHLDGDQKVALRTEIRRLQSTAGLTSVLVTHDQTEAMAMADRIAVMNDGVLQQVGQRTGALRDAGQPLRRRLHRQLADELLRRPDWQHRHGAGAGRCQRGLAACRCTQRAARARSASGRKTSSSVPATRRGRR